MFILIGLGLVAAGVISLALERPLVTIVLFIIAAFSLS
jgi:hypothetical protein